MSNELICHARKGNAPSKRVSPALLLALTVFLMPGGFSVALASPPPPVVIYDNIPTPLPPNVPSEGFQANGDSEMGELIQFAGTNRTLRTVTVTMSDWALFSDYAAPGTCPPASACTVAGWSHPITLNLYNVTGSGVSAAPGSVIATMTPTFSIPWRPVADPTCSNPTQWRAGDGNCYDGFAFNVTFDFTGMGVTLPNQIIYGVAFNTQTYGYAPIGAGGPFISLNLGVNKSTGPAPFGPPTVGSNPGDPDTLYLNEVAAKGNGGTGTFSRLTGWAPFSVAASFDTDSVDMAVTKTPSGAPYPTGGAITYTITATNNGSGAASNVSVTDVIPPGTAFVSATPSQGNCSGTSTVTCALGTIAGGGSATISLMLTLPSTPRQLSNTATVTTSSADTNPANDSSTSTITVIPTAQVPALSPMALLLLCLACALIAMKGLRL